MENLLFLGVPKFGHSLIIMCLDIGTPSVHHFPFGTNGKVVVLGVPILKHIRVGARHLVENHFVDATFRRIRQYVDATYRRKRQFVDYDNPSKFRRNFVDS